MADKTLFDKILQWYSSPNKEELKLTADEQSALDRWDFIDNLFRTHGPAYTQAEIKTMTMEKFEISASQFYYDVKNTHAFFGSLHSQDKNYMRAIQVEYYKRIRTLAENFCDLETAIKASQAIDKLLGLYKSDIEGGEIFPTTLQIIIKIGSGENQLQNKTLNIDHLQKISKAEFKQLTEATDQIIPDQDEIAKILLDAKSKRTRDE